MRLLVMYDHIILIKLDIVNFFCFPLILRFFFNQKQTMGYVVPESVEKYNNFFYIPYFSYGSPFN